LPLRGLGESAAEILKNKGLTDEPKWENLIQRYSGNPSWLNIIASTIQDLFNGSVDRFLSYPTDTFMLTIANNRPQHIS
jgi:hypothetical protein